MKKKETTPGGGLTKADLIDRVYSRHGGLTKSEAAKVVDTIFRTVKSTLVDGRAVKIQNFGVFEVRDRPARQGVSPASGEPIEIPEQKGLSFRPSHKLRSEVAPLGGKRRRAKPPES